MAEDLLDSDYELFIKRDYEPMLFSIPICPEKEHFRKLIETYGGTVTAITGGPHSIRLIPPTLKAPVGKGYDTFSTRFIEDCVANKKLLDLNCYRIGKSQFTNEINVNDILLGSKSWVNCKNVPEDSGEEVSDFDNDDGPSIQLKRGFKPNRRDYSHDEKVAILQFIIKGNRYSQVKGRSLWEEMEAKKVCKGRTWGSMKEHFRKSIMNNLHLFKLTDKERRQLCLPYVEYKDTDNTSVTRNKESSSESDTDIDIPRKQRRKITSFNEDRELRNKDSDFDDLLENKVQSKQKVSEKNVAIEQEQNKVVGESRHSSKLPGDEIDSLKPEEKEPCKMTHKIAGPVIDNDTESTGPSYVNSTKLARSSERTGPEAEESSVKLTDTFIPEQPAAVLPHLQLPDIVCSAPLPPNESTQSFDPVLTSQEFSANSTDFLYFSKYSSGATSSIHCRPSSIEESLREKNTAPTGNKPDMVVSEQSAAPDIDNMHSQMFANIALPESSGSLPTSSKVDDGAAGKSQDALGNESESDQKNDSILDTSLVESLKNEWNEDSDSSSKSSGLSTIIFELSDSVNKGKRCPGRVSENEGGRSCRCAGGEETCISESEGNAGISLPSNRSENQILEKCNKESKSNNGKHNKILSEASHHQKDGSSNDSDSLSSESEDVDYEIDSDEEPIKLKRETRIGLARSSRCKPKLQGDVSTNTKEQDDSKKKSRLQAKCSDEVDDSPGTSDDSESELASVASKDCSTLNASNSTWTRDNMTGRYDRLYNPGRGCKVGTKQKPHNGFKRKQNLPYTDDEDVAILEYIIEKRAYGRLRGREFWQDTEKNLLPQRTWQSLKERFRMRIAKRLPSYVNHGISEGRLRRLSRAINNPNIEIKEEESEKQRRLYSRGEDEAIVHFIIKNKRHAEVAGKMMWVLMSKKVPTLKSRTWLSLKERFRKRIINHLEDFNISLDDKKRMLMNNTHGSKVRRNMYFSSHGREESSSESNDSSSEEEEEDQPNEKTKVKSGSEKHIINCMKVSNEEKSKRSRQIVEKYLSKNLQASSSRCVDPGPSNTLQREKANKSNTTLPQKKRKRKLFSQNDGVLLTLPKSAELEIAGDCSSDESLAEIHDTAKLESKKNSNQVSKEGECSTDFRKPLIEKNFDAFNGVDSSNNMNNANDEPELVPDDSERVTPAEEVLDNSDTNHTSCQHSETEQNITPNTSRAADAGNVNKKTTSRYSIKSYFEKASTRSRATGSSDSSSVESRDRINTRSSGTTPKITLRKKAVQHRKY